MIPELKINTVSLKNALKRAREQNIIIPTFAQQRNPDLIPEEILSRLKDIGLWEIDPANLFRISWKNKPADFGGGFGNVNYIEFPPELTGVKAKIVALVGKWFPTGSHKVGATFGCLAPKLVSGQFDPVSQKAVWPSTGNFCRGGTYNSVLLGCESMSILPEEMSRERFEWLEKLNCEIIRTPGSESNVKEIFDKCRELRESGENLVIFNQFEESGNYMWHYSVTGSAVEEVLDVFVNQDCRPAGFVSSSGSAGTLGCGDYLKKKFDGIKIAAVEALQCPTLLYNGYGSHRIEGIGDKHVPWIHNVRNTDLVIAVDDENCMNLIRLFNTDSGKEFLLNKGVNENLVKDLDLVGISGISNLIAAIKTAKYYELTEKDIIVTVLTDSIELYKSRLTAMNEEKGEYKETEAARDFYSYLRGIGIDHMRELDYYEKKRIHNLKYFTWVEQQSKSVEELNSQWYEYPEYWENIQNQAETLDNQIKEFNDQTGLTD